MAPSISTRRIRRLRVRADAEDDARQAITLLTDALRTASLPLADQGRLIVIRRLPLGRISVRVSPASLALHIERVMHDVVSQAVAYDRPAAGDANAVAFQDRGAAIITLARLHARGAAADEWFWAEVVHGWRADVSQPERWSLLLEAAHAVPEAAIVASAVIDEAVGAGLEDGLLASVPAGQGARWLRLEGWSSIEPDAAPAVPHSLTRRRADVVDRWQRTWGPADDRLIWLNTLLVVREHPACVADPRLPARIAGSLMHAVDRSRVTSSARRSHFDTVPVPGRTGPIDNADPSSPTTHPEHVVPPSDFDAAPGQTEARETADADPSAFPPAASAPANVAERIDRSLESDPAAAFETRTGQPDWLDRRTSSGHYTPYAGLLFLVPILERLGFAQFLAAHPALLEIDFPARLIWLIGQRIGMTPDDPLALVFNSESIERLDACDVEDLPPMAREILSAPPPRAALESPVVAWTTAVRRWCRRNARQGLIGLIRRPGRVHVSRTHIDACFTLSQLDVRLRRLALDVNPGWVPWMGRVVQFSYLERHDRID